MLSLPVWAKARIAGVAVWQWLGFVFSVSSACSSSSTSISRRAILPGAEKMNRVPGGHSPLTPLAVILLAWFLGPLLSKILHITGSPLEPEYPVIFYLIVPHLRFRRTLRVEGPAAAESFEDAGSRAAPSVR